MTSRGPITTHVLDTSRGSPAIGIAIRLEFDAGQGFAQIGSGVTDDDGRVTDLLQPGTAPTGHYRIHFSTQDYFEALKHPSFFPTISIDFRITDPEQHHHIPLLLSPFGYTTYRGS